MGLLWPAFLLLLVLIPLIVSAYVWVLRRRRRFALHYSSLSLIREAIPGSSRWRRHLPLALFLLALASLIVGMARPVVTRNVTSKEATIILALDVSLSMCASDISPNRLTVAQEAAESFILSQDPDTRIGIVAFAGFAELIVPPTADREVSLEAVRNLVTARATAIGSAILRSIDAISEVNKAVAPVDVFIRPDESLPTTAPDGTFQPEIIVLLTDGASNSGALPLRAAQAAADRGIRVYTIGFGTSQARSFNCTRQQLGGIDFGNGFGRAIFEGTFGGNFARRFRLALDEDTLQRVAAMTGAEYYLAESADELFSVFADLPAHLVTARVTTEVSAIFAAIGALFAFAAVALALRWNPLP